MAVLLLQPPSRWSTPCSPHQGGVPHLQPPSRWSSPPAASVKMEYPCSFHQDRVVLPLPGESPLRWSIATIIEWTFTEMEYGYKNCQPSEPPSRWSTILQPPLRWGTWEYPLQSPSRWSTPPAASIKVGYLLQPPLRWSQPIHLTLRGIRSAIVPMPELDWRTSFVGHLEVSNPQLSAFTLPDCLLKSTVHS